MQEPIDNINQYSDKSPDFYLFWTYEYYQDIISITKKIEKIYLGYKRLFKAIKEPKFYTINFEFNKFFEHKIHTLRTKNKGTLKVENLRPNIKWDIYQDKDQVLFEKNLNDNYNENDNNNVFSVSKNLTKKLKHPTNFDLPRRKKMDIGNNSCNQFFDSDEHSSPNYKILDDSKKRNSVSSRNRGFENKDN